MVKEFCAGAVVFKIIKSKINYLILCSNQNIWVFPKGHMEKDETEEQTALREIFEETGLKGKFIKDFVERTTYNFIKDNKAINKSVVFFLFEAENRDVKLADLEHKFHKWMCYEDASKLLTYDDSKKILEKADEYLKKEKNKILIFLYCLS